ncbi:fatty acid desaturase family protein [Siphonobacter aquaeclarae]|jgi:linoleoyl-CoA desaturase|uniref:Linoleoyl-CoA desaturase n=1 Tax=Siphonobacter aquaeclarae TaxID=563176 RepID=A0A1G9TH79_9BACT|nr:acyl-CoA desaturase [Siphonobacter aquaeclarae]SDM47020.1 linoleoyl-CoA desaturase [Siphonobacter aquaeclarae]
MTKLRFLDKRRSTFFSDVRQRVDAYFEENQLPKQANQAMWNKTFFFLGLFALLYGLIISDQFNVWVMLVLAIALGMTCAFIGFNICHDAVHGSFTSDSKLNRRLGLTFNLIGGNPYVWSITHNIVHHTYTNIPGHDEDLEIAPGLIRIGDEEPVTFVHRFQHIYSFLLYGLASLSWVLRKDYLKFFKNDIGKTCNRHHPRKEYFNLFFFKAIYYTLFIVFPLVFLSITWWQFVIGFLVMHFFEGLTLGLVFQLAHIVEHTEFPEPNGDGNIEEAWAVHQMQTTANFSVDSKLAAFLCGGLNFQVEHHLFPKICHIHYPAISRIVRQTAADHGIPYIENRTFWTALQSHYRVLLRYGREEYLLQQAAKTAVPAPVAGNI